MTKQLAVAAIATLALAGCASKPPAAKAIHERPWIGGEFETVPAPPLARERHFKRNGALVTRASDGTPLAKSGVREGDLVLAINGRKIGSDYDARDAFGKAAGSAIVTLYRAGKISEVTVTPGVERFQNMNNLMFSLSVSPHFNIDLFPNPDFNLIALGYESKNTQFDLDSPRGKYLKSIEPPADGPWQGLRSEEGWKTWLGPISVARHRVIVSQEAAK